MMLKVMDQGSDWWILEGVKSVHKSWLNLDDSQNVKIDKCIMPNNGSPADTLTLLTCALQDGRPFVVAADTKAYLLNDNGKTIEVLNSLV
jgi:hypothetical protein